LIINQTSLDKTSRNETTQEKEERMAWNGSIDSAARSGGRLLEPVELGRYTLPNRMMMSAMTRNRAGAGDVPTASVVRYYEQRSGAGLIITEGSPISPQGIGYPSTPGVHSDDQVDGWRRVTEAVHGAGGSGRGAHRRGSRCLTLSARRTAPGPGRNRAGGWLAG